jgi:hypothetical protein
MKKFTGFILIPIFILNTAFFGCAGNNATSSPPTPEQQAASEERKKEWDKKNARDAKEMTREVWDGDLD